MAMNLSEIDMTDEMLNIDYRVKLHELKGRHTRAPGAIINKQTIIRRKL